jgi:hypothetical protein
MRLALVLTVLAAAVVGGLAGAALGFGAGKLRPARYVATANARAPVADASCTFFSCPTVNPGPTGIPYVASQALYLTTPPTSQKIAGRVSELLKSQSPTTAALLANVKAAEVGSSTNLVISYTAPTSAQAQQVAAAYANAYVSWSNGRAVRSLRNVQQGLINESKVAKRAGNKSLETVISNNLAGVVTTLAAYKANAGPNAATDYGLTASAVPVKRTGLVAGRSAGIGAFVGSIIGVVLLLMFLARSAGDEAMVEPEEEPDETLEPTRPAPEPVRRS